MNIGLVLRTVAHLRPAQVLFQVLRRVHKARFKALACPSVEVKPMAVEPAAKWRSYDGRRFAFLNIEDEFRGWNNTAHGMLWAYNQNYMDWLCQPGMTAAEGARWIDRFIADMPTNRVGLDPYPIALRAINWVKFSVVSRWSLPRSAGILSIRSCGCWSASWNIICLATICWRTHTRFILAARILKTAVCTAGRAGCFAGS